MSENEIHKTVIEIEQRYMELSDEDWYKIVEMLLKRVDGASGV